MEDSMQNHSAGGSPSTKDELRKGVDDQQEILSRLSRELDNYFALRGFGKSE